MGALATCVVRRKTTNNEIPADVADHENGFLAGETEYEGTIIFFENLKAYVIKTSNKGLYWVPISLLADLEAIV